MKVTFIIKNLTDETMAALAAMSDMDRFNKLRKWAYGDLKHCVSMKVGSSNAFRDQVDFNTKFQSGKQFTSYKIEPRKGYKLATFEM